MASDTLPENRVSQIQAACITFFVLTPVFVGLRVWSRVKLRSWSSLDWDDFTIFASWVSAVILSALVMVACTYGFGQHIINLSLGNLTMTLKIAYVADIFYKLTINLTKASILLLYLRTFDKKWFKKACYVSLGVVLTFMVATTATSIGQCSPVSRIWDPSSSGSCINLTAYWYANSGITIVTDVLLLVLPFQPIHASHMPSGQKVALMVVFAFGMFTTVTTILRMQALDTSFDITYNIDAFIWTIIEANLAIICACLPVCKLPLGLVFPAQFPAKTTIELEAEYRESPAPRSQSGALNRLSRFIGKKPAETAHDKETGVWDEEKGDLDLPLPPSINPGNPRRVSTIREAYVWLSTVI
ncbi:integral membrane protein [Lasiosphaeria hispida]|uniref:Integral membrane protein n=1 Tax=Lasiosphaeria hispida TaxID=260671 RepID=A0AAJ0HK92_9PEZI|nr:integral membrane protein [Lasiosphaeria hispida]